jgi:predicted MPP superfamily phosphohydrolase
MAVRYLAAVGVEASAMVAVIELVAPQQPAGWSGRRIAALADTISAPVMSAR